MINVWYIILGSKCMFQSWWSVMNKICVYIYFHCCHKYFLYLHGEDKVSYINAVCVEEECIEEKLDYSKMQNYTAKS